MDIADCTIGTKVSLLADRQHKAGVIVGRRVGGVVEGEIGLPVAESDETSDMVHVLVNVEKTVGISLTTEMPLYPAYIEAFKITSGWSRTL